jgi:alanine dehydrogenase
MKFECIKGIADNENVVAMQGDAVKLIKTEEGSVYVEGEWGWCSGWELIFSPKEFVVHFKMMDTNYNVTIK